MTFRPHTLFWRNTESSGHYEGADWIEDAPEWSQELIPCRCVPNGKALQIALQDGTAYLYQYTVYMDRDVRTFSIGEEVKLFQNGGEVVKQVRGFSRNQLHAKIWV